VFKFLINLNRRISNRFSRAFPGFTGSPSSQGIILEEINAFIKAGSGRKLKILEAGGIDRPLLEKSDKYTYDGLDIEHKSECDEIYHDFLVQSIEEKIPGKYHLIISFTLLEHVKNNQAALSSIYASLQNDGKTINYLPSKHHPYSIILRMVGDKMQKKIIRYLRPWAQGVTGYPAFFDECSPREMKKLLSKIGCQNIAIIPFYRANDYFSFCFPLFMMVTCWENICRAFNWTCFCSGFIFSAEK